MVGRRGVAARIGFEFATAAGATEIVGPSGEVGAMLRRLRIDGHAANGICHMRVARGIASVIVVVMTAMMAVLGGIHTGLLRAHAAAVTIPGRGGPSSKGKVKSLPIEIIYCGTPLIPLR
jgi:hypothetical protein